MRITAAVFVFAIIMLPAQAFAATLGDLVGNQRTHSLRAEESLKSMAVNQAKPTLTPNGASGARLESEIAQFGPNVIVEALYLYKKPAALKGSAWTEAERVMIFNILQSLSTLTGIEYYSASRAQMRVFYEKSYVVDGPDGQKPLQDPTAASVPERVTLYAVQKDLTFGENRYRYDYVASSADFSFTQTNLTHMSYGIIPLIGKDALKTMVLVSDTDEGYVLYAVSAVKTMLLPGIDGKVKTSFSNRADAIYRWFSTRMDASFASSGVKK